MRALEALAHELPSLAVDVNVNVNVAAPEGLVLIGRRDLRSNNSWMHNVPTLVRGEKRCALLMHPNDASTRGLVDGDVARGTSNAGELRVEVHVTASIMPGVVSLPHGWGHGQAGARLPVAAEHAGVNANALTDDRALDPISGTVVLNGVPVLVTRASDLS